MIDLTNETIEQVCYEQVKDLTAKSQNKLDLKQLNKTKAINRVKQYSGVLSPKELYNELGIDMVY